jgi:acyl-CoA synthetase (NDP forming)
VRWLRYFDWAKENEIGFSEFITMGNKAVLNENHILEYWLNDTENKIAAPGMSRYQPVGLYLESIIDGRKFLQLAKQVAKNNPIFILKPGKSQHAQQAIQSHTGSMAGDAVVQEAAFAEAGIIRWDGVEDMFDLSKAFSWENAPKGPRVAVVSNAGGPAVISTDVIEKEGLQLAALSKSTAEKLKTNLPRAASVLNPVDVLGDALSDRYQEALIDVLSEKNVDAVIVILTPQIMTQIEATAKLIGQLSANYGKPIICCFMGGKMAEKGEKILNSYKIPSYRFPERAIKVLASMWKWQSAVKSQKSINFIKSEIHFDKIEKIVSSVEAGNKVLSVDQSEALLKLAGIKIPVSQLVESTAQAKKFLKKHKGPIVLKISSPNMIHKTDGGGVIVNIRSNSDIDKAWQQLNSVARKFPKKFSYSFHAQQQIEDGLELIAGVKYNGSFGNVLMFGAGGILAELIGDSNLSTLPLDTDKALALIASSKMYKLLKGFRGHKPYAMQKLAELLVKLGNIAQASLYFSELTINPIIVTDTDAWAVDPRIILR